MAKPRLLFLSHTLPYPPDTGAKSRTYHTLRALSGAFDTTALCFYRRATLAAGGTVEAVRALTPYADVRAFEIPEEARPLVKLVNHARSMASGEVYTRYVYASPAFRAATEVALADGGWHAVHLDSLDLSGTLDLLREYRTVCVHHDVQSQQLARRADLEQSAFRRGYLHRQAALMRLEEARWCPRVSLNVAVSEVDAAGLRRIAPGATITVIPNGTDLEYLDGGTPAGEGIVFVGGADWGPNLDAMEYFGAEVLPILRQRLPDAPVRWIGRIAPGEATRFSRRYGIDALGRLDDIRPVVRAAACVVVPLRAGSGTRVKILDAWALRKAVVSTTLGAEGLEAVDGENVLLRDSATGFAAAVADVVTDAALRQRLGEAGYLTVRRHHDWRALGDLMIQQYLALPDPMADPGALR